MDYPLWLEILLAISMAVALMGLGAWMLFTTITKAINAASKLETKRSDSETKALNKWQKLYEDEHQKRADDNALLIAKITDLECENKRMKQILKKAKVADL